MEFEEVVRSRRMVRNFSDEPIPTDLVAELLDVARRAPSAGNTQGTEFLVLQGAETDRFWDCTLPSEKRSDFPWPGLLLAPLLVLPLANRGAYLNRYGEPDKVGSLLGPDPATWPVPYWDIDCAFATMNLLLAAHAHRLGALFFAVVNGRRELLEVLSVPDGIEPIGAVAIGRPKADRPSASASRGRRPEAEVVHWGHYGQRR